MPVLKQMTDRERKLFEVFKRAVAAEQKAQEMYREAIEFCDDPGLKTILVSFHADECRHEKEVIGRYQQFRKDYETGE